MCYSYTESNGLDCVIYHWNHNDNISNLNPWKCQVLSDNYSTITSHSSVSWIPRKTSKLDKYHRPKSCSTITLVFWLELRPCPYHWLLPDGLIWGRTARSPLTDENRRNAAKPRETITDYPRLQPEHHQKPEERTIKSVLLRCILNMSLIKVYISSQRLGRMGRGLRAKLWQWWFYPFECHNHKYFAILLSLFTGASFPLLPPFHFICTPCEPTWEWQICPSETKVHYAWFCFMASHHSHELGLIYHYRYNWLHDKS